LIAASKHSLPRTLIDAYVQNVVGGTGKRIDDALVDAVRSQEPLWMAGGISPENISEIVDRFAPELVDLSTSLEASFGQKSEEKLRKFFKAVR
jgi:indole-3-glycerol phosphate synthase/phosphoribosylanthranilate isomerase